MRRRVILYELNEVPWDIVDLYVGERPGSNLATVLGEASCITTVNEDPVHFQPWRTWPTFHNSQYTDEHNSFDLGQDPATFRGDPMWEVVDRAGLPVGIFGPLQSWPAHPFASGGFYMPDTFARTPETVPPELSRFQAFNLSMTRDNAFASDAALDRRQVAGAGVDLVRLGLTPKSALRLATHLVRERREPRYKASRSVMQVVPTFDLYWRLHRKFAPALSIFFTNHVAGMMHRYWGDAVPGYGEQQGYRVDEVYKGFVIEAMDAFDAQLGRMRRFVADHPETVVVIASSMGQGPIPYREMQATYVVEDAVKLAATLGLGASEPGLAMYPRVSLQLESPDAAALAAAPVESVVVGGDGPLFCDVRVQGATVSFDTDPKFGSSTLPKAARYTPAGAERPVDGDIADLGIVVRPRLGGGNTAFHIAEGTFIAFGPGIAPDASRTEVSVLDAAPSILGLLGVAPAPSMHGAQTIFARQPAR